MKTFRILMKDKVSLLIQAEKADIGNSRVTFLKGQDIVAVFNLIEIVGWIDESAKSSAE